MSSQQDLDAECFREDMSTICEASTTHKTQIQDVQADSQVFGQESTHSNCPETQLVDDTQVAAESECSLSLGEISNTTQSGGGNIHPVRVDSDTPFLFRRPETSPITNFKYTRAPNPAALTASLMRPAPRSDDPRQLPDDVRAPERKADLGQIQSTTANSNIGSSGIPISSTESMVHRHRRLSKESIKKPINSPQSTPPILDPASIQGTPHFIETRAPRRPGFLPLKIPFPDSSHMASSTLSSHERSQALQSPSSRLKTLSAIPNVFTNDRRTISSLEAAQVPPKTVRIELLDGAQQESPMIEKRDDSEIGLTKASVVSLQFIPDQTIVGDHGANSSTAQDNRADESYGASCLVNQGVQDVPTAELHENITKETSPEAHPVDDMTKFSSSDSKLPQSDDNISEIDTSASNHLQQSAQNCRTRNPVTRPVRSSYFQRQDNFYPHRASVSSRITKSGKGCNHSESIITGSKRSSPPSSFDLIIAAAEGYKTDMEMAEAALAEITSNNTQLNEEIVTLRRTKETLTAKLASCKRMGTNFMDHLNSVIRTQKHLKSWNQEVVDELEKVKATAAVVTAAENAVLNCERKSLPLLREARSKIGELADEVAILNECKLNQGNTIKDLEQKLYGEKLRSDSLQKQVEDANALQRDFVTTIQEIPNMMVVELQKLEFWAKLELSENKTQTKLHEVVGLSSAVQEDTNKLSSALTKAFQDLSSSLYTRLPSLLDMTSSEVSVQAIGQVKEHFDKVFVVQQTNDLYKEEVMKLRQIIADLRNEKSIQELEIHNHKSHIDSLKPELMDTRQRLAETTQQLTTLQNRPQQDRQLISRLRELENKVRELEACVSDAELAAGKTDEQISSLKTSVRDKEAHIKDLLSYRETAQIIIEGFETEKQNIRANCDKATKKCMEESAAAANSARETIEHQHQSETRNLKQKREEAEHKLFAANEELKRARDEALATAQELHNLRAEFCLCKEHIMNQVDGLELLKQEQLDKSLLGKHSFDIQHALGEIIEIKTRIESLLDKEVASPIQNHEFNAPALENFSEPRPGTVDVSQQRIESLPRSSCNHSSNVLVNGISASISKNLEESRHTTEHSIVSVINTNLKEPENNLTQLGRRTQRKRSNLLSIPPNRTVTPRQFPTQNSPSGDCATHQLERDEENDLSEGYVGNRSPNTESDELSDLSSIIGDARTAADVDDQKVRAHVRKPARKYIRHLEHTTTLQTRSIFSPTSVNQQRTRLVPSPYPVFAHPNPISKMAGKNQKHVQFKSILKTTSSVDSRPMSPETNPNGRTSRLGTYSTSSAAYSASRAILTPTRSKAPLVPHQGLVAHALSGTSRHTTFEHLRVDRQSSIATGSPSMHQPERWTSKRISSSDPSPLKPFKLPRTARRRSGHVRTIPDSQEFYE